MAFRVLVTDPKVGDLNLFEAAGRKGLAFDLREVGMPADLSDEVLGACDAFCMFNTKPVGADMIDRMTKCRVLVRAGVGFDNVDLAAAARNGIPVANVPDYGINEVADHALALMMTFTRGIRFYSNRMQAGLPEGWVWDNAFNRRTYRRKVGIIGLGRIGSAFARRCQGLGMEVMTYDPYLPSGAELSLNVTRVASLKELLGACDIISMHVPLTDETKRMIDAGAVAAMKPGTFLINTSRGPVIDLDAVHDGLRSGPIQCLGLDVYPVEPADPEHPLIKAWLAREPWIDDRLVLTPHSAFFSPDAVVDMRTNAIHLIADYLEGKPLRNWVNGDLLAADKRR